MATTELFGGSDRQPCGTRPAARISRRLLVCLALIVILAGIAAVRPAFLARAPRIVCDEPVFHFGVTSDARDVEHEFFLRNAGRADLVIRRVEAGCSCTTAQLATNRVAAGESVRLAVRFSTRGRQGPQARRVVVRSNDPARPSCELQLAGDVRPEILVEPAALSLRIPCGEKTAATSLRLRSPEGKPFRCTKAEAQGPGLTVTAGEELTPAKHEFTVAATAAGIAGTFKGRVELLTDLPGRPRLEVPVSIIVESFVDVVPREIFLFCPDSKTRALSPVVALLGRDGRRPELAGVVTKATNLAVEVEAPQAGSMDTRFRVILTAVPAGRIETALELKVRLAGGPEETILLPVTVVDAAHQAAADDR